ncbi:MAG: FKBP-type peptidyl-prolyl cis-trans isomerase [Halodesulfurarchaeum sp.]|nr:FKBP-type peptidyl-prolyl cis-trans isomerase [Halodesulfurarchaeum sp.]
MSIESGDSVTIEYTGKLADGTVFDTSRRSVGEEAGLTESDPDREYEPLSATVGTGEFIEGIDDALLGMEQGESKTVEIPPEKGYGEWTEEHVIEYNIDELGSELGETLPEEGTFIQTGEGSVGEIVDVDADAIRVDFNHRLAGETLTFDIEVLEIG